MKGQIHIYFLLFFSLIISSCNKSNQLGTFIPTNPTEMVWNKKKAAILVLNEEINRNSNNPENFYKRAKIYFEIGDFKNAKIDCDAALQINQNDGRYRLLTSELLRNDRKYVKALEEAKLAELLGIKTPELYILIGDLLQKNNLLDESEKYLHYSREFAPFNGEAFYYTALLKQKQNDTTNAIAYLLKAKQLKPKFIETYKRLSEIYTHYGQTDLALSITADLAKQYPNDPDNAAMLGKIYQRKMNIDSALIFYKKAIKLKPNLYQTSYDAGLLSLRSNLYDDAIVFFENTYKYAPKTPFINTSLGMCFENLGQREKALEYYTIAFAVNNRDFKAIEGIKRLEPKPIYFQETKPKTDQSSIFANSKVKVDTVKIRVSEIQPKKIKSDTATKKFQVPTKFQNPTIK